MVLALGPAALMQACSDAMTSASTPIEDAKAEGAAEEAEVEGSDDEPTVTDAALPPLDAVCTLTETMREAGPDARPDAGPDADLGCRYFLPCGAPGDAAFHVEGCQLYSGPSSSPDSALGCWVPESFGCMSDVYVPPANGSLTFDCFDCFGGGGRRPPGLLPARRGPRRAPPSAPSRAAIGEYFARMAYEEAASIHAFVGLEEDLARLGAPPELVAAAARCACDEVRQARAMARRARACGGVVIAPRVRRRAARSLESIARENAVEGCVHETFGALQLRWQATHAPDRSLRRTFARVAADETRHAALAWLVAEWAEPLLEPRARRRVAAARSRASRVLRAKLSAASARDFDHAVGRPSAAVAVALLDGLVARWDAASGAG
ncbi:MAG: hypothetical protein NVS3B10_14370 [Polyangiales bacterium]